MSNAKQRRQRRRNEAHLAERLVPLVMAGIEKETRRRIAEQMPSMAQRMKRELKFA